MSDSYALGEHYKSYVQAQLASGRFSNPSEVLRAALELMEQRDRQLSSLARSIDQGLDDIARDRLHDFDAAFDELESRYERMANERGER